VRVACLSKGDARSYPAPPFVPREESEDPPALAGARGRGKGGTRPQTATQEFLFWEAIMKPRLLIVDKKKSLETLLHAIFPDHEATITLVSHAEKGLQCVAAERPNVVIFDMCLPEMTALEFLRQAKLIDKAVVVIMTTSCGRINEAIETMQNGAFDYLVRPIEQARFGLVLHKALECNLLNRRVRYASSHERTEEPRRDEDVMIGSSPGLIEIWKMVGKIANSDLTVLIEGESGTGKELLARAIHSNSRRSNRPFLAINCAALPETLLESEMFGYEKGAFTDAKERRIGIFEQCNGGTILLDEIGAMSLSSQAKLLRILENKAYERIGGRDPICCDVRIIACTNEDMEEAVRQKRFRFDLYHRLRVICFQLPPLRDRVEDIPLLIDYFCKLFSRSCGKELCEVTAEARELLISRSWCGNIRELRNVINSAVTASAGRLLDCDDFVPLLASDNTLPNRPPRQGEKYYDYFVRSFWPMFDVKKVEHRGKEDYTEIRQGLEKAVIHYVMVKCRNNQVLASRQLGMSRNTLRERLKLYSLDMLM
jgi:two-component system, NtrC family, nitrogen regulation response regulator GlnG